MIHEINIYGDIVPFHSGWGDEYSLKDLNADLSRLTLVENDELVVNIHTYGGCTATAFGIRNKLQRFKKENNIMLTTRVDGWCASSGVIILLASTEKRIGNSYAEPFIHNAWTFTIGDKNEHQKHLEDLVRVDDQISNLYAEVTSISKEEAVGLMNSEGFVTAQKSLEYGFFTELEDVEIIEVEVMNSIKKNHSENRQKFKNNMSEKNRQSTWNKLKNQIDDFFKGTKNKIVFTADNSELDFYELGDDDTPKAKDGETAGDKAKFDGKPAGESNNGEYVMPSGETYKFEGEELIEIIAKEEEEAEETEALKTENAELKTEVENLKKENKILKSEKSVLNVKLNDAKSIIKNFKEEMEDDEEEEEPVQERRRNSKNNTPGKRNLFKHLK